MWVSKSKRIMRSNLRLKNKDSKDAQWSKYNKRSDYEVETEHSLRYVAHAVSRIEPKSLDNFVIAPIIMNFKVQSKTNQPQVTIGHFIWICCETWVSCKSTTERNYQAFMYLLSISISFDDLIVAIDVRLSKNWRQETWLIACVEFRVSVSNRT